MNIRAIGNTYVYNTETKYLSRNDEKGNDSIGYAVSDESCPKNNFEPALSYSEYKEIADNWRLSQVNNQSVSDEKSSRELLQGKIEEMQENIENGDLDHEPVVKIGASEFTETEWDTFLENFDDLQEEILSKATHIASVTMEGKQDHLLTAHITSDTGDLYAVSRKIFFAFADARVPLLEMSQKKANLEDIFLELTESPAENEEKEEEHDRGI